MPTVQKSGRCSLCDAKNMTASISVLALKSPAVIFDKGLLTSDDLAKYIALLKSRKASLLPRIMMLYAEVSIPTREALKTEAFYAIEPLLKEGMTKKSVNTCKELFAEIGEIIEKSKIGTDDIASKKLIAMNLDAEVRGLNQKIDELSILYKKCIDQILLTELKFVVGHEKFEKAVKRAKVIYSERNMK